jgi:hypothetical protein
MNIEKHYLHSNKGYSKRNSFNLLCQKVAHNAQLLWNNDTHAYMRLASDFEQKISKATKSIKHVMGELFTIAKKPIYSFMSISYNNSQTLELYKVCLLSTHDYPQHNFSSFWQKLMKIKQHLISCYAAPHQLPQKHTRFNIYSTVLGFSLDNKF